MTNDFSLLRPFTCAEGATPCAPDGTAVPAEVLHFLSPILGLLRSPPLAWLDGKPVYPDSLICWDACHYGQSHIGRADSWRGWTMASVASLFSWPTELKEDSLGSADKYVTETFEFDFILGGAVSIECSVGVRFGNIVRDSLKVEYCDAPFDYEGIVIDYEGEFLPLSDYLYGFAKQEIREARKETPA